MTWWTGNVMMVLLAAIPLLIVGFWLALEKKRRRASKEDVANHKMAWRHFIHAHQCLPERNSITLFDARVLRYPMYRMSDDSSWNWLRGCLPAEVTVLMTSPTPAELERVIRSDAKARRALFARSKVEAEERAFFPFRMQGAMAMWTVLQGAPDRPFLHDVVGRPWLVEGDRERTRDIVLLDIGLRCHAVDLAEAMEEEIRALVPPVLAPTSKAIWVQHMHGNC